MTESELKKEIQDLRVEIEELKSELDFVRQRNTSLSSRLNEQKDRIWVLEESLNSANEKIEILKKSRAGRKPQNDTWMQRYQLFLDTKRKNMSPKEAMQEMGIGKTAYYRYVKYYKQSILNYAEEDSENQ